MLEEQSIDIALYQIDTEGEQRNKEKFINFFYLMDFWMNILEEGKEVASFFVNNQYRNAAIYGLGLLGKHLQNQLENSNFPVVYTIDKNIVQYNDSGYGLMDATDIISKADVIVVTPIMEYALIKEKLMRLTSSKIISLEEVILSI